MRKLLKEIAVISSGQNAPQGSNDYSDNGIPFVKAGNLYELLNGRDINEIQKVSNDVAKKFKLKLFKKGTILFAKSGMSCLKGYVYILPCDAYVVNHLACVIPKENISDYLSYFFNYHKPNQLIKDSAYPSISLSDIGNIAVNLVEDSERVHHVQVLDGIQKIVLAKKQELKLLDDLIKARFVEMFGDPERNPFGWEKVGISTVVCGKASNGFFAKRDDYKTDGNVAVLGVAYIVNRMYSQVENLPRTNASVSDIQKYRVKYGDMLFCRSSLVAEGIGKASIVPENTPDKTLFECHVIRLQLDLNKCIPEFIQVLSTTDYFRNQIIAQSKTATMTTIGQEGILKTTIVLPPKEKQREFYSFVKQIDKSKFSKIA